MLRMLTLQALLLPLLFASSPATAADFKLVVNAANPVNALSSAELGQFFLKKSTRWENGSAIEPVDLAAASATRAEFSQKAHGKSASAVKSYWQRQIYSGRGTPPPELSSDAEVLAFVRSHPSAIGYVAEATPLGDGLKVVKLSD